MATSHPAPLDAYGEVPQRLMGEWVAVGTDGVVHHVALHDGRVHYHCHSVAGEPVRDLIAFAGTLLVVGDDFAVRDAGALDAPIVEPAGPGRSLAAVPVHDPASGELHLVAREADGALVHVVVAPGALTRRSRPVLADVPVLAGIAVGTEDLVLVTPAAIGLAERRGEARPRWVPSPVPGIEPVAVYRRNTATVLLVLTPALERWSLTADGHGFAREVLAPVAVGAARPCGIDVDGIPSYVWTTGGETLRRYDLSGAPAVRHTVSPKRVGAFALVADPTRAGCDNGWLLGAVHDHAGTAALVVVDAATPAADAVATIPLPAHLPFGARCAWLPTLNN